MAIMTRQRRGTRVTSVPENLYDSAQLCEVQSCSTTVYIPVNTTIRFKVTFMCQDTTQEQMVVVVFCYLL